MEKLYLKIKGVEDRNVSYVIVVERSDGGQSEQHGITEIGEEIDMTDILIEALGEESDEIEEV